MFQCSSASRKFLNSQAPMPRPICLCSFSALQRAENSSIAYRNSCQVSLNDVSVLFSEPKIPQSKQRSRVKCHPKGFQCSSASRKFLNHATAQTAACRSQAFQCSSASRKFLNRNVPAPKVKHQRRFQCSSASRKFLNKRSLAVCGRWRGVSVLFSEPKIPQ